MLPSAMQMEDMPVAEVGEEDLPILGEPLAVELANTLYGEGDDQFDFLDPARLAGLWLKAAGFETSASVVAQEQGHLVRLRNAVRSLLVGLVDGQPPSPHALKRINSDVRRSQRALQLEWSSASSTGEQGQFSTTKTIKGAAGDQLLSSLAEAAIKLLRNNPELRRCAAPDCTMLFVKRHHLRRFCHESCSHRSRQARYYRRQRDLG